MSEVDCSQCDPTTIHHEHLGTYVRGEWQSWTEHVQGLKNVNLSVVMHRRREKCSSAKSNYLLFFHSLSVYFTCYLTICECQLAGFHERYLTLPKVS